MQPKQELTEETRVISTGMKELLNMAPGSTSRCQKGHRSVAEHAAFNWSTTTLARTLRSVLLSLFPLTHVVSFFFFF